MNDRTDMIGVESTDRWHEVVLPILRYIGTNETALFEEVVSAADLAAKCGLDDNDDEAGAELSRLLEADYVACHGDGPLEVLGMRGRGDIRYYGLRLTERGARTIRMWPPWPADELVEALVDYVDRQVEDAEDEDSRKRWQRFKTAIHALGTNLVAAAIMGATESHM